MSNKSFFRRMLEEKKLIDSVITVQQKDETHLIDVDSLVVFIESLGSVEKRKIQQAFSQIDFRNGNLVNYLTFLAAAYVDSFY